MEQRRRSKRFWTAVFEALTWALEHPTAAKNSIALVTGLVSAVVAFIADPTKPPSFLSEPWQLFVFGASIGGVAGWIGALLIGRSGGELRQFVAGRVGDYRYLEVGIRYEVGSKGEPLGKLVRRRLQNTSSEPVDHEIVRYHTSAVDRPLLISKGDPPPPEGTPYIEVEAIDGGHIQNIKTSPHQDSFSEIMFCFDKTLQPGQTMDRPYIYRLNYHFDTVEMPPKVRFTPEHDVKKLQIDVKFKPEHRPAPLYPIVWENVLASSDVGTSWGEHKEVKPNAHNLASFTFPGTIPGQEANSYRGYGLQWAKPEK